MANISNSTSNTLITGTSDADTIENLSGGRYVTIESGDGDDVIQNKARYSLIKLGAGNDSVYNTATALGSTINADHGNNKIVNEGCEVVINGGSGDDHLSDLSSDSTINSGKGDNDIETMWNTVVNLGNGNNYVIAPTPLDIPTINVASGNDTIQISPGKGAVINGSDSTDKITLKLYPDYQPTDKIGTIKAGKGDDIINATGKFEALEEVYLYAEGDGNDIIYCYDSADKISITSDSHYSTMTSGNDIIIQVGDGSMTLKDAKDITINIAGGTYDSTTTDPTIPSDPTVPGDPTVPSSSDIVKLTNDTISPYTADSAVVTIDASARTKAINITANAKDNVIIGSSKNDTFTGGNGNDTFFYTDGSGKDVITDYSAGEDVIKLTSGTITKAAANKKGDLTLTVGKGSIKLNGGVGKRINIIDSSDKVLFNQSFGEKTLKVTDSYADTINAAIDSVVVTIDSSERTTAVDLTGNAKANYFKTGAANETITSGKGKDTIEYNGGNDVITDYTAGQDKLKLSVNLTNATVNENDVVLTTGSGTITLKDAKSKKITTIDKDGLTTSMIYGSSTTTITNADGDAFKALGDTVVLDSSKRTKPVNLIGNSAANTLIGGKNGKKKFDTLTGGAGADTFLYNSGAGNDIITDYSASEGDIIQLGKKAAVTGLEISNNDLILTIGKGKITVQGGATQTVTVIDDNGIEANYKQSSRNNLTQGFEERWFLEDNFETSEIDSMINDKIKTITIEENVKSTFNIDNFSSLAQTPSHKPSTHRNV